MSIIPIQCLSESDELLFPQITLNQIVTTDGKTFEDSWSLLKNEILQAFYPVNSIVILESSSDPNELFPNTTWEKTSEGKILVGKGYLDGNTSSTLVEDDSSVSSAYSVQITGASMPSHNHALYQRVGAYVYAEPTNNTYDYRNAGTYSYTMRQGGGGYHSNVMPYICANIWTRVA